MEQAPFGFDFMFGAMPFFMMAVFILVFVIIIITAFKALTRWNHNNHSPVLTVTAKVVAKRTDVHNMTQQQAGNNAMASSSSHTSYYTTFEVESGDRMELPISSTEYGMLAEGDTGRLTFQGTRFLNFERNR